MDWTRLKIIWATLCVIILSIAIFMGFFFWSLFRPVTPITIESTTITTPTVASNGVLHYDLAYCKDTDTHPIVFRQIHPTDTAMPVIAFPSVQGVTIRGCHTAHLLLPMIGGTLPGEYKLSGHLVYQINNFRSAAVDYTTKPFLVTAPTN